MTKNWDIVVMGSGESGTGAALLAKARGLSVFVSDSGTIGDGFRNDLADELTPLDEFPVYS